MKRLLLIALLTFAGPPLVKAAAPEDLYIKVFNLIVKGDELQGKGQGRSALEKYLEADRDLKNLKAAYANWQQNIVDFRLKYLAKQIGELKVQYPNTTPPARLADTVAKKGKGKQKRSPGFDAELHDLNERLIDSNRAKTQLEDQLREALAARPADIDPGAYQKAQERIRTLEKSDDVNQVTLQSIQSELTRVRSEHESLQKKYASLSSRSRETQLKDENGALRRQIRELQGLIENSSNSDELKRQVSLLQADLQAAQQRAATLATQNKGAQMDSAAVEKLKADNANLQTQIQALSKIAGRVGDVESLNQKVQTLESELSTQRAIAKDLNQEKVRLKSAASMVTSLRSENTALKSEVAQLNEVKKTIPDVEKLQNDLAVAKAKAQTEQSLRASLAREKQKLEDLLTDPDTDLGGSSEELKALQKENTALQKELKKLSDDAQKNSVQSTRIKALETERERLQQDLERALKSLDAEKKKAAVAPAPASDDPELKKKLQVAEARITSLESQAEPYTAQELALMKPAAAPTPKPQPKREFPASAAQIALQAQRAYESRRYEEAEQKYQEILSLEESNVYTLANLAAAQMELNKLAEAEANLKKALSLHADDAFSLSLYGLVKFRQNDYDSALDMLSRAAVLNPDNAQTQNYLGLALSQKGLRIAAEAAFRKAVKLAPGYSVAHYNLAVFYATAKTPSPELAKWHYQKARAAGHPKSEELENMLAPR